MTAECPAGHDVAMRLDVWSHGDLGGGSRV